MRDGRLRKRISLLGAMLTYAVSVLLVPASAMAVDGNTGGLNLITSPLPISLVAKPGTTVVTDLKVKNNGSANENLKVGLLKFGAFGEDGKPRIMDFEPTDPEQKWVSFSQNTFLAEPNVWKTIKMTIKVPKTAAFGYYYAATFSRAQLEKVSGARQNAIAGATATLVLLEAQVPGAKRQVDVAELSSMHSLYEFLPATFTIRLRNTGNVHVAPRGNIFITQGKRNLGTIEVNSEQGNILPKSFRQFDAKWNDGFPAYVQKTENGKALVDKRADPIMSLKWDFNNISKFRFGKYTANMTLVYDDGKRDVPVEAAVAFWVVPWRGILVILVVVALLGYGLYMIIRNATKGVRGTKKRKR